jgi:hypothetical protein
MIVIVGIGNVVQLAVETSHSTNETATNLINLSSIESLNTAIGSEDVWLNNVFLQSITNEITSSQWKMKGYN